VELLNPYSPFPGAYPSYPHYPHVGSPIPKPPTPMESPHSDSTSSDLSALAAGNPIGPAGISFHGGSMNACVAGQGQPPDVAADVSGMEAVELLNGTGMFVYFPVSLQTRN
jgi:hypothetical protein